MQALIILVTLGCVEMILRVADFRELRDGYERGYPELFRHDSALGWSPIPNSVAQFHGSRTITVKHNGLGLRDIEHDDASQTTILFVGDSFVWGYDVEAEDRFTELLRDRRPGIKMVNAGVPGYGTAQEYLLLERIWSAIQPNVVVLVVCSNNDHDDNSSNVTSAGYFRPYLEQTTNGAWRFAGQPVPRPRHAYFNDNALIKNSWLARVGVSAFIAARHPRIVVPDSTERLIKMMRDFVEARGATLMIGLTDDDPKLEGFLLTQKIQYESWQRAPRYMGYGGHWTPRGHAFVAERLLSLFHASNIADALSGKREQASVLTIPTGR